MKLTQSIVTIDLGMYGKSKKAALCAGGLAIVKMQGSGAPWCIYHRETGIAVGTEGHRKTQAAAKRVLQALFELPINWSAADAGAQVGEHLDAVKVALKAA